jgi:hypothetical protein
MKPAIASETVVEYHFRCFCGAPIVATKKTVTCANCGETLRVSRRQHWNMSSLRGPRPHRKLQVEDLGALMNRIVPYFLLGFCLLCVYYLGLYVLGLW